MPYVDSTVSGKCKRELCKFRHLSEVKNSQEQNEPPTKPQAKVNVRKVDERGCCLITLESKHCRSDYDECSCECKRRRLRAHSPDIGVRYDTNDNRRLWVRILIFDTSR